MTFDVRDEGFWRIVAPDARVGSLVPGLSITEGTIWHPRDNCLIFSDLTAGIVYRWTELDGAAVLRKPSNISNGNFIDRQGRVLSCEHASSCVSRIDPSGRYVQVLASHYQGKELNSPNDIIVDSQDRIWFTDPHYGRTSLRVGVERPLVLGFQGVYRIETDGQITLIADDFAQPNGLCLTPDESALLVNDTDRGHIRRFEVHAGGRVTGGEVLAEIAGEGAGKPDGMKVDTEGRIYCTGPGGIHVLSPKGQLLGVIGTPALTRNFCFGGPDFRTLFLAMQGEIGILPMRAKGVAPPRE